jgi:asparagine synthase (glutamine-hydrolysing)
MCGLAGVLSAQGRGGEPRAIAERMALTLRHRGPDDLGVYADESAGVALGHTRLAIIELSALGHQPMASPCGRFVLAFNGEIYNFRELRRALAGAGHRFRGESDTEVALVALQHWGVEAALARFNGMFALAFWDRRARTLELARDRLGEKPLYYGRAGRSIVFASELGALRAHPEFRPEIDRAALAAMLRHGYVPAPGAIYEGVRKLPAGCRLRLAAGSLELPSPVPYWRLRDVALAPQGADAPEERLDELHRLLADAVALRMTADVPVGAFLSGGVDSSLVSALMQSASARPVKTYAIGFDDPRFDEAARARAVARFLGTEHSEVIVTRADALDLVPALAGVHDEPFADPSQLPTLMVSRLARADVKVALSGDGGDELFGGYRRYRAAASLWRLAAPLPRPARAALGRVLGWPSPRAWEALGRAAAVAGVRADPRLAERAEKAARAMPASSAEDVHRRMMSPWPDPSTLVLGAPEPEPAGAPPETAGLVEAMLLRDAEGYLPDDILVKLDRASMSLGLEARVPLLDHRVVECAWRFPVELRIRDGVGKWPLRAVLARHVPPALTERPKQGFDVPVSDWLRGPLRGWAEDLLAPERLRREGLLRPEPVARRWREHLDGRREGSLALWHVLMFQSWLERQGRRAARSHHGGEELACARS